MLVWVFLVKALTLQAILELGLAAVHLLSVNLKPA